MTLSKEKKYLNTISKCENLFVSWLNDRYREVGFPFDNTYNLTELLTFQNLLPSSYQQFAKPIQKWNTELRACYKAKELSNKNIDTKNQYYDLLEQTTFNGILLVMTFQKN